MPSIDVKWRFVKGNKHFMCSNTGEFLTQYDGSEDWVTPKEFIGSSPPDMMAITWLGMTKKQKVEFIDGNKFHYALENLRVVDVPKNITIKMKFDKDQVTKEMVEQVLKYVPETGAFLLKVKRPGAGVETWKHAGEVGAYYMISLFGQWYKAQEIAVLVMNGDWPRESVNVRNGNWGDARWSNIVV